MLNNPKFISTSTLQNGVIFLFIIITMSILPFIKNKIAKIIIWCTFAFLTIFLIAQWVYSTFLI